MKKSCTALFLFLFFITSCTEDPKNIDPVYSPINIKPYTDLSYHEVKDGSIINFFSSKSGTEIYYDATRDVNSRGTSSWTKGDSYIFDATGEIKLFVKDTQDESSSVILERIYSVIPEEKVFTPMPAVRMKTVLANVSIAFTCRTESAVICTGYNPDINSEEPLAWDSSASILLDHTGDIKVFAKAIKPGMLGSDTYSRIYNVVTGYPADAVFMNSASIISWAAGHTDYTPGTDCDTIWRTPEKADGKARGTIDDIVSLGNGGRITMYFLEPVKDENGFDFAVFENAFNDTFLELAFVEVSTNGTDFVRFDCLSLTSQTDSNSGNVDTAKIGGLAGKYRMGYGTPFDLSELSESPDVINGKTDLANIRFIRLVDIVGDGSLADTFGGPIYDPYPSAGSAGFDLDAIGVMNE